MSEGGGVGRGEKGSGGPNRFLVLMLNSSVDPSSSSVGWGSLCVCGGHFPLPKATVTIPHPPPGHRKPEPESGESLKGLRSQIVDCDPSEPRQRPKLSPRAAGDTADEWGLSAVPCPSADLPCLQGEPDSRQDGGRRGAPTSA